MLLEGTPAEAGEWRFSALPWFDPATGQFRGYRASARRPQRNETPYGRTATEDSGDSIRQLIHELRSPLNAISGFAQIIRSEEHTSELQSLMRISYAVFCLKKKITRTNTRNDVQTMNIDEYKKKQ